MLFSVLASRKGVFIRDSRGEESGLFPVGLQGEPERHDGSDHEQVSKAGTSAGGIPVLPVVVQLLTDEGLSRETKLLQQTMVAVRIRVS